MHANLSVKLSRVLKNKHSPNQRQSYYTLWCLTFDIGLTLTLRKMSHGVADYGDACKQRRTVVKCELYCLQIIYRQTDIVKKLTVCCFDRKVMLRYYDNAPRNLSVTVNLFRPTDPLETGYRRLEHFAFWVGIFKSSQKTDIDVIINWREIASMQKMN